MSAPRTGRLARAALLLSASFALSRVLGVLRNVVIADIFGTSRAVDAYFAAFRIPDTMFALISGGALASAFIPVFAGLLQQRDEDTAWRVASTVLTTVFIVLAVLALLAFAGAGLIMGALVPSYTPAERALTVELTRIMLLQPIFLGVQAIVTAILQTYHRFFVTAVAPLLYNIAVIAGALLFGSRFGVAALAWSVVIGAVGMLAIQIPGLGAQGRFRPELDFDLGPVQEVLHLFGPRFVGFAAFQAMLLITLYLAQGLPEGMVSAINYAWPIIYFPVGALGTAAANAIFPTLSRLGAVDDLTAVRSVVNRSLRLVLFLAVPAEIGLIVLRRPIVNLLYHHGKWSFASTEQTAFALLFYALAIAPLAAIEVLPRVFYALKDTRTPVQIAVVSVIVDAILSVLFVHLLPRTSGQGGLALATAIATTAQAIWLAWALQQRLSGFGLTGILLALRDTTVAGLAMGCLLYILLDPLTAIFPQTGVFGVAATLVIELALGAGAFVGFAYILGAPELWQVGSFVRRLRG